jgi:uncharacterized protein (TIGR04255 family)
VTERPVDLPDFAREPLNEVAIGVLFQRLDGFRQAHFGLYWALVSDAYPNTVDRERLETGVENLVAGPINISVGFKIIESAPTDRAWFISADDSKLIQLQDDRFLVNWRRGRGEYPRFEAIRDEFNNRFGQFSQLTTDASLGPLTPAQIEVSYFNRIVGVQPDEFLRRPAAFDLSALGLTNADSVMMSRFLVRDEDRPVALLVVEVQPTQQISDGIVEAGYQLVLTYRQPLTSDDRDAEIQTAMAKGRDTIVRSFTELTSEPMHKEWERTK